VNQFTQAPVSRSKIVTLAMSTPKVTSVPALTGASASRRAITSGGPTRKAA